MTATDAKWTERIRQWKESGKTAEEFAVGQPFKPSTLKWRASELRRNADGAARQPKARAATETIRMARVVSRGRTVEHPSAGVVVEVAGARIAVSRGFDAELLADVVRALGASR